MKGSVRQRDQGGFSLVEVLMALVLGVGMLSVLLQVSRAVSASYEDTMVASDLEQRSQRGVRAIRELLLHAVVADGQEVPIEDLRGFAEGSWTAAIPTAQWIPGQGRVETTVGLSWVLDEGEQWNGADDDGDGVVDEGHVHVRSTVGGQAQAWTLAKDVAWLSESVQEGELVEDLNGWPYSPPGLRLARVGGLVVASLTLQARTRDGRTITRTATTSWYASTR